MILRQTLSISVSTSLYTKSIIMSRHCFEKYNTMIQQRFRYIMIVSKQLIVTLPLSKVQLHNGQQKLIIAAETIFLKYSFKYSL